MLIFLQFKKVNFSVSINSLSFFLAIFAFGHIIYMLFVYFQKIRDFSATDEVDDKYKGYFAKMFFSSYESIVCRSYNLIYIIAKFGMTICMVVDIPYNSAALEVFFFVMFLANDAICILISKKLGKIDLKNLIFHVLANVIIFPMVLIPCIIVSTITVNDEQLSNLKGRYTFAKQYTQIFIIFKILIMVAELGIFGKNYFGIFKS